MIRRVYTAHRLPKKGGGFRTITAPCPELKAAQRQLVDEVISHLPVSDYAHAFRAGRSTVTNAAQHCGQGVVVTADFRDFFGSFDFWDVYRLLRRCGFSRWRSARAAWIGTLPGKWTLPQGAPTSPALTNALCYEFDLELGVFCREWGWTYTRYADDLTFSHPQRGRSAVASELASLLSKLFHLCARHGLRVHPEKLEVNFHGFRQKVTGLVVNDKPGPSRRELRRFRAAVHRVQREGFRSERERDRMLGWAAYAAMSRPALGRAWVQALTEAQAQSVLSASPPGS